MQDRGYGFPRRPRLGNRVNRPKGEGACFSLVHSARGDFLRSTRTRAEIVAFANRSHAFKVRTKQRHAIRVACTSRAACAIGAKAFAIYGLEAVAGFGAAALNNPRSLALVCAAARCSGVPGHPSAPLPTTSTSRVASASGVGLPWEQRGHHRTNKRSTYQLERPPPRNGAVL